MQKIRSIILTVAAIGLFAAGASAQGHKGHEEAASPSEGMPPPKAETMLVLKEQVLPMKVTVTGEVIDVSCFLRHAARGAEHAECAAYCAVQSMSLGILDAKTSQVYLIIPQGHYNPTETMAKHIGMTVQATGLGYSWGGLRGIEVREVWGIKDQAEKH
jgi:hypothetical protein